jgi:hypothetical protein
LTDGVEGDGGGVVVQSARQPGVTDGNDDVPSVVNGVITADDEVTVVIAVGEVTDVTAVGKVAGVTVGEVTDVTAVGKVAGVTVGTTVTNVVIDVVADAVLGGIDVDAEQKPRTNTILLGSLDSCSSSHLLVSAGFPLSFLA